MPFFGKKKKDPSKASEAGKKKKSKMPLFRRQSEKCRTRQQDQEMLAQQDPEPHFDMSSCECAEVPAGVYAICKVLQKQVLLLHDNWLTGLSGGGDLCDLRCLKVLDLHNNELKALPDEIGSLKSLQVLDLADNKLKHIPAAISQLASLQTLNLKNNRLKEFPEPVCDLRDLRTLDVSGNDLDTLPVTLCQCRALETLVLDADRMAFPCPDTCRRSTQAVCMFLCGEAGIMYEHPSKYWLKHEGENQGITSSTSDSFLNAAKMEADMTDGLQAYQNILDKKRKDAEDLEKQIQAEDEVQAQLAADVTQSHRVMMQDMTKNHEKDEVDLTELNNKRDLDRQEFLAYLNDVENGTSSLIAQLLDYNCKAKETEELMEVMEEERLKEDDAFTVRWEEYKILRKQEVLDAMHAMLSEFSHMEEMRQVVENDKDETRRGAMEQESLDENKMESLMYHKQVEHGKMVANLAEQDELQRTAFEALVLCQDSAHSRIRNQIFLIEKELAQLTAVEMDQRTQRMSHEFNVVCDQRIALSGLLSQLLEEKDNRALELRKRLIEMEQQREDGQTDYWLVQYQRLLDWKPQALIDRESQLEIAVKNVLTSSGAEDYIPLFARHRITIETLLTLNETDLERMGVHELGLRRAILKNADLVEVKVIPGEEKVKAKLQAPQTQPSAPPAGATSQPDQLDLVVGLPPALVERQASVTARGLNSECAVCLDSQSSIIFLPCGHVCCCVPCSQPLSECPLCRAEINLKVKLTLPQMG